VDGGDDLFGVDALEVDAGSSEVSVAKLALDHVERHAFTREFDGVGMAQLVVVPTSAQAPLCRPDGYAEVGVKSLLRRIRAW
jgi:hypothetical protein